MFTGIVQELGTVESVERSEAGIRLRIGAELARDLSEGGSIAVSGVCLTATALAPDAFEADVMNQTARVTTLAESVVGDRVNLEPPLRAGDPLGGHVVQGHVDCVGEVQTVEPDGFARRLRISVPAEHRRYLVEHGSVTVDGTSLTIAALTEDGFEVSLIPETLERTTLGESSPDAPQVNLEFDLIARYVERLLGFADKAGS